MLGKFWSLFEKKDDLIPLKKKLIDKLIDKIPDDFIDSIGDQEIMKDPVVSVYGHIFERTTIEKWIDTSHTCPLTRAPLAKEKIFPASRIKFVLDDYRTKLNHLLSEINTMKTEKSEVIFKEKIKNFHQKNSDFIKRFATAKQHDLIETFKNLKKIDMNKTTHLEYWDEKPQLCYFGLKDIRLGRHYYHISPIVYNVMKAANNQFENTDEFHSALLEAQSKRLGCWSSFWGNTQHGREMTQMSLANPFPSG